MMRKEAFVTIIQADVLLRCLSVSDVAARYWVIEVSWQLGALIFKGPNLDL